MFQNDGGHELAQSCWDCHRPSADCSSVWCAIDFWGEHGWTDLGGMHSMSDMVEYTARYRKDQLLRGYDWDDGWGSRGPDIRK